MDLLKIEVAEALKLKPGDRVLLKCSPTAEPEDLHRVLLVLEERFPDVTFAVLAGDIEIAHQPAGSDS